MVKGARRRWGQMLSACTGLTQCGIYTTPSSAMNSSTPQCDLRPVVSLLISNSIG